MNTVVCFGDSITRGQVSANYVKMLSGRLNRKEFHLINAGINNDFSYNLLQRVDVVIAEKPQVVTILIGTNDIAATLTPLNLEVGLLLKGLPRHPDPDWYRANLLEIVQRLKAAAITHIGLASIPVLGEDLDSPPIHIIKTYNEILKEIAGLEQTGYIPVFERQAEYLCTHQAGSGRPYLGELHLSVDLLASRLLRKESYNSISRREGFALLTDGVHMNSTGAQLIARAIESFILAATPPGGED